MIPMMLPWADDHHARYQFQSATNTNAPSSVYPTAA